MPELPEVETVRRGLAPVLEGRRIDTVELRRADLRFPLPDRFAERITGTIIGPLGRRAKYLLLPLATGETLILHLGMSGRVLIEAGGGREQPGEFHHEHGRLAAHDHVMFQLSGGARVIYNDVRRFGFMRLAPTNGLEADPFIAELGPEPLGNAFHSEHLLKVFEGRALPLKSALLDQKKVAGLGNIYVCEALNRSGLSPYRAARSLKPKEARRLVSEIRAVLEEAIAAGGSTLRDFRHEDGSLGYFQHNFRVYGREGEACPTPGCGGAIERQVQSGRSTFFCGTCQT
ncbi:MAG: bifunctional DNA-formamidopyrimidine glycosylase/DNA-(apurinic or apyrimidinic site) lyase [Methylobacterium sp.]|jgi:formamidopyrimidine-DNA glycosylase|nr:bifunctional DNA-formamidopyrimidine glycosylase/DNA-(apurinic or apyrimidinic site) lyase [Methylobacterium sp.]